MSDESDEVEEFRRSPVLQAMIAAAKKRRALRVESLLSIAAESSDATVARAAALVTADDELVRALTKGKVQ